MNFLDIIVLWLLGGAFINAYFVVMRIIFLKVIAVIYRKKFQRIEHCGWKRHEKLFHRQYKFARNYINNICCYNDNINLKVIFRFNPADDESACVDEGGLIELPGISLLAKTRFQYAIMAHSIGHEAGHKIVHFNDNIDKEKYYQKIIINPYILIRKKIEEYIADFWAIYLAKKNME